jgi:hypothetical protein
MPNTKQLDDSLMVGTTAKSSRSEVHTITGRIKFETMRAIQIAPIDPDTGDEDAAIWIPISQTKEIHKGSVMNGKPDRLVVTAWIAKQKGLV